MAYVSHLVGTPCVKNGRAGPCHKELRSFVRLIPIIAQHLANQVLSEQQ